MSNLASFEYLCQDQDADGSDIGVILLSEGSDEEVTVENVATMGESDTSNLIDYGEETTNGNSNGRGHDNPRSRVPNSEDRRRVIRRASVPVPGNRPVQESRRRVSSIAGLAPIAEEIKQERSSGFLRAFLAVLVVAVVSFLVGEYHYRYGAGRNTCAMTIDEQVARWNNLQTETKEEVFGQHIAIEGTLRAIYAHITDPNPKKALVLCFHGWLGSGKTFLSHLIAKHLFEGGMKSPHVKSFIGPRHFLLDPTKLHENQENLAKTIEETVKGCERSLFIFDEVDKMPSSIFNVLVPFIGPQGPIDGVDYSKATFIFLSNTGGDKINKLTYDHWRSGELRTDLNLYDFRKTVAAGAFSEEADDDEKDDSYFKPPQAVLEYINSISQYITDQSAPSIEYLKIAAAGSPVWEALKQSLPTFSLTGDTDSNEGGLFKSEMITRKLVDHYIPFLPLERKHVMQCAKRELKRRNVLYIDPSKIADRLTYFPEHAKVFAEDGCKNIMSHVAYFVHDSDNIFEEDF